MEYRKINKFGIDVSLLGFGCMRFPMNNDGSIDEIEASKMIDKAIENGVNYIDTAYPYHSSLSEPFVGKVIKKYPRESLFVATKLPVWDVKNSEDTKIIFEKQLARLDVDYVDFYLLHALNKERWETLLELGVIDFCEEMQRIGKIKYFGFSFHDEYEVFETIINYRDWDFCQIQLNYIDTDIQAGIKGYNLAASKEVPVIVMEPIKGGFLATLPTDIENIINKYDNTKSLASWALRWVGTHDNVKVILSGMSTMEQVEDNLQTVNQFKVLNNEEMKLINTVATSIKAKAKNGCTGCEYCMPCPFGVNIARNFKIWNEFGIYGNEAVSKNKYESMSDNEKAENCKMCGKCEKLCPQSILIREDLKSVMLEIPK